MNFKFKLTSEPYGIRASKVNQDFKIQVIPYDS
jgi:hypothetical protein